MRVWPKTQAVYDLLGSSHVFASAVRELAETPAPTDFAGIPVSTCSLNILTLVARTGNCTVGDVARFLQISSAAASKAVDKLVRQHWLRRAELEPDRRVTYLHLTHAGQSIVHKYTRIQRHRLAIIFNHVSPLSLETASSLLDNIAVQMIVAGAEPGDLCMRCGLYARKNCSIRTRMPGTCFYERRNKLTSTRGDNRATIARKTGPPPTGSDGRAL